MYQGYSNTRTSLGVTFSIVLGAILRATIW